MKKNPILRSVRAEVLTTDGNLTEEEIFGKDSRYFDTKFVKCKRGYLSVYSLDNAPIEKGTYLVTTEKLGKKLPLYEVSIYHMGVGNVRLKSELLKLYKLQ